MLFLVICYSGLRNQVQHLSWVNDSDTRNGPISMSLQIPWLLPNRVHETLQTPDSDTWHPRRWPCGKSFQILGNNLSRMPIVKQKTIERRWVSEHTYFQSQIRAVLLLFFLFSFFFFLLLETSGRRRARCEIAWKTVFWEVTWKTNDCINCFDLGKSVGKLWKLYRLHYKNTPQSVFYFEIAAH